MEVDGRWTRLIKPTTKKLGENLEIGMAMGCSVHKNHKHINNVTTVEPLLKDPSEIRTPG